MRTFSLALGFAALFTTGLSAQVVITQDSSLRKLQRTYVRFHPKAANLAPDINEQLSEYLTLELRKAGFLLAEDAENLKDDDGLLDVSLFEKGDPRAANVELRIALQQRAELKRTGQSLWMVTWYDENRVRATMADSAAKAVLANGLNRFLNRWLSANGR